MLARPRSGSIVAATLLVTAGLSLAGDAWADDGRAVCLDAHERSQELRNAGKLLEAREQLASCARSACPKPVRDDCTQWIGEILRELPSVVPAARDRAGNDLVDVRLLVDGKERKTTLDGKAISLDPGPHTLRFEMAGAPPVEQQVVLQQGVTDRTVGVTIAVGEDPSTAPPPRVMRDEGPSFPVLPVTLGGLGLVTAGAGLYLNLDANSDVHALRDTCAPSCSQSDVDDVVRRQTISVVALGVGGALVVAGVVLYLVGGHETKGVVLASRGVGVRF